MDLASLVLAYSSGHAGECIILYSFHDNKYFVKSEKVNDKFNQSFLIQKQLTLIKITFCGYIKHGVLVWSDWMFVGVAKL